MKAFLISFSVTPAQRIYDNTDGSIIYALVYADNFEAAVIKLKDDYENKTLEDIENCTIE